MSEVCEAAVKDAESIACEKRIRACVDAYGDDFEKGARAVVQVTVNINGHESANQLNVAKQCHK